eukprot:1991085-Amphidinium_carterae.1
MQLSAVEVRQHWKEFSTMSTLTMSTWNTDGVRRTCSLDCTQLADAEPGGPPEPGGPLEPGGPPGLGTPPIGPQPWLGILGVLLEISVEEVVVLE